MEQNEVWKAIPGHEGRYEVSSLGRVKSLLRGGRILKPANNGCGYLMVSLGGCKTKVVHRLVLLAFVGAPPAGMEACHKNDIPDDNRIENLRWDTRAANVADRKERGYFGPEYHGMRGQFNNFAKLTEDQALSIIRAPKHRAHKALAREFGVDRNTVRDIRRGIGWAHLPRP